MEVSSLKNFVAKPTNNKETARLKAILEDLKIQLRQRGAKGFVGLQRKFRIMDDNGDHALDYLEFKKAMKECALNLTDEVHTHFIILLFFLNSEFEIRISKCYLRASMLMVTE